MSARPAIASALLLMAAVGGRPAAQQTIRTFRSTSEAILVPVSVSDNNRPVSGLTAADFDLLDNGTMQKISLSTVEALPVDVTLVLDKSGSVNGAALAQFRDDVQQMSALLQINDRVRLITFGTSATNVSGLQPGGAPLPVGDIVAGGATAFYGAVASALMAYPQTDRPNMVFAFSDGLDNSSFLDADRLVSLSGYSGAALFVVLEPTGLTLTRGLAPYGGTVNLPALKAATARTGGALYDAVKGTLPSLFKQVLEDFRSSYVLSYVPSGVTSSGWHEIAVKVKGKSYVVRARKGYDGG